MSDFNYNGAWKKVLEAEGAVCSLSGRDHQNERVPVTWENGEAFAVFEELPGGRYDTLRIFSVSGEPLAEFSVGWPVEGFPEWLQPFDIPEGGALRQPLGVTGKKVVGKR